MRHARNEISASRSNFPNHTTGCSRCVNGDPRLRLDCKQWGTNSDDMNIRRLLYLLNNSKTPSTQRDYEVIPDDRGVLSPHHYSGPEDVQLFFSSIFKTHNMSLVALEVGAGQSPVTLRAQISPDAGDFEIDKSLVLGVWCNHTRFIIPTSEPLPSSWSDWRETFGDETIKPWT